MTEPGKQLEAIRDRIESAALELEAATELIEGYGKALAKSYDSEIQLINHAIGYIAAVDMMIVRRG